MEEPRRRIRGYRDLEVWQKAMEVVIACYRISDAFPRSEQFGLTSQMRRAATSVPANIAEGHGRGTTGEYIHHLTIAHGSLMELETHVEIAGRLGYMEPERLRSMLDGTQELGRMINALVTRLRARTVR